MRFCLLCLSCVFSVVMSGLDSLFIDVCLCCCFFLRLISCMVGSVVLVIVWCDSVRCV